MLRIGLTGGIGCGKSRVCNLFVKLGIPIIDSDQIARELVEPGSNGLYMVTQEFGDAILHNDGTLDRAKLRELVFADKERRQKLEAILHPLIRQEMQRLIDNLNAAYVILAIPLLLEKGWQSEIDRVVVVDCSESQQMERAQHRDGSSAETIRHIINSQIRRSERLAAADDIIDNSGPVDALLPQVERLHQRYLKLAANN
ncbi:MAG: dephospho-CoA kinase [Chromatiales bacterium]|nr:dephospho-CoA kinase [Chromatiales bacterium]